MFHKIINLNGFLNGELAGTPSQVNLLNGRGPPVYILIQRDSKVPVEKWSIYLHHSYLLNLYMIEFQIESNILISYVKNPTDRAVKYP